MTDCKTLLPDDLQTPQETGRCPGSTSGASKFRSDGNTVSLLKMMSDELPGPLVSMVSTLKLLNRGYYGKMDGEAAAKIREVLSNAVLLTGMVEAFLGKALAVNGKSEVDL